MTSYKYKYRCKHVTVACLELTNMFFRLSITFVFLLSSAEQKKPSKCLTGYMTDVQSWVDTDGDLTSSVNRRYTIDLSTRMSPVPVLHQKYDVLRSKSNRPVTYFSMAKCQLTRIPPIFRSEEEVGRWLSTTVEFMTFYGNTFMDLSTPGEQYDMTINATTAHEVEVDMTTQGLKAVSFWSSGFGKSLFPKLQEVDLRACSIRTLSNNIFEGMPNLRALYLGENKMYHIDENAFAGLRSLIHLDFSRNEAEDFRGNGNGLISPPFSLFSGLQNLTSLDLSFTKFTQRNTALLRSLSPTLQRLSICSTGLTGLSGGIFKGTSLKVLDISGNNGILNRNIFMGIEGTLQILYANDIGLNNLEMLANLNRLEVLKLSSNEISMIPSAVIKTLTHLQILDLNKNRLPAWFTPTFSLVPNLKYLSMKQNNMNVISQEMIEDFVYITYLALSGNFIVCSCHTRDFFEMAARNEINYTRTTIVPFNSTRQAYNFHTGYSDFNQIISQRYPVFLMSQFTEGLVVRGKFKLVDFKLSKYKCLSVASSKSLSFDEVTGCPNVRDIDYDVVIMGNRYKLLALLVIPCLLMPLLILFIFKRNFKYCCITLRNSAMLSLINQRETAYDATLFNYDVFVSYCNEDRGWVLDHLLPHLESDCSISACLHERDFQVGLSILENIVSCMDRSRCIMLIISQRFLMSQWCQFEMHLAQHRLLETRREDLTLVLLEEIPRHLRPTTLHYLMLTKTYIVWPNTDHERGLFWKRLRKTLITHKLKQSTDNVSLA